MRGGPAGVVAASARRAAMKGWPSKDARETSRTSEAQRLQLAGGEARQQSLQGRCVGRPCLGPTEARGARSSWGAGYLGPGTFFCYLPRIFLSICCFLAPFPLYLSILLLFSRSVFTDSSGKRPTPGYLGLHPQHSYIRTLLVLP